MAWFKTLTQNDSKDMYTLLSASNNISSGILFPIMLLVIFVISLLGSVVSGRPIHRSLVYSSFICSILAILMVIMNWLSPSYMYFLFLICSISLIWTKLSESYS